VPDNTTVTIGADTSKFRGELKLLQAELANLDRQIKGAVKAGDTARAKELSTTFGVMKDKAVALDRSLKDLGRSGSLAFNEVAQSANRATESIEITGRSAGKLFKQLRSLTRGGSLLGSLAGGGVGGAAGFIAGLGLSQVLEQFDELAKSMREIRDLARQSAAPPLMVQGFQELASEAGKSEETAKKFLSGVSSTIQQVATTTEDATAQASQSFATFGDKTVQVFHGATQAVRDFSKPLAILQVDQAKLKKLPYADQVKVLGDALLRTAANAKQLKLSEIQLNEVSKSVFGVPLEDAKDLIKATANRAAKEKELAESQRGATAERLAQLQKLEAAQGRADTATKETLAIVGNAVLDARVKLNEFISDINKMTQAFAKGQVDIQQAPSSADQIQTDFKDLAPFFDTLTQNIKDTWGRFWKEMDIQQVAPNASDQVQTEFKDLPPFFDGLTKTLGGIWKGFWGLFISEAKAATLDVKSGLGQIQTDAKKTETMVLDTLRVTAGAAGVTVGRGPGTGDTGGYGPESLGGAGYGPGSRPTQSILPGVSDYQKPLAKRLDFAMSAGSDAAKSAADSSADAAAASKAAAEASAMAVGAWVNPSYAEGGMVHGPGTPTSDSVTARLSAGEFVMRAAAVQRWGPQFMQALNGMGDRMPSRGIPSFASGGMVTAGGGSGAVVNLVFPGGTFGLRGDNATVGALTREARRAGMLAAGRPAGVLQ
jgi:gas vesicle protein